MRQIDIKKILEDIAGGKLPVEEGLEKLSHLPSFDAGCAEIDSHRPLRNGFSEVIYGEHKSVDQLREILSAVTSRNLNVLATRVNPEKAAVLGKGFENLKYDETSRTFSVITNKMISLEGNMAICCAGTADISVAEEAYQTAIFFGVEPRRYYDIGVAGLHRLVGKSEELKKSDVIIVIAGMEGALPSVVGGMFSQPIIAVPTSVGYGTNFSGITALMSMLNSCAEGVVVTNIDNGFGAACSAIRILQTYAKKKPNR